MPKYLQVSEMLIREIAAGLLPDGERLPPERDMAADLGISVGTLRKALADLEVKGLLERRQGSGNYVRAREPIDSIYSFFRLELRAGGGMPTADILDVVRASKPPEAGRFGTATDAFRIRRIRFLSGAPAALEEIWLDGDMAEQIDAEDLGESIYLHYKEKLGFWITEAEDLVGIDRVPDWAPQLFGPAPGTPCAFVERWSAANTGGLVEYSRTWFDSEKARYVNRLR